MLLTAPEWQQRLLGSHGDVEKSDPRRTADVIKAEDMSVLPETPDGRRYRSELQNVIESYDRPSCSLQFHCPKETSAQVICS